MQLSKRLSAIAALVTRGSRVADVGCDHGYIPIHLVEHGIIGSAIAMDVNEGPLERARQNMKQYAAAQYIETRLSDGVAALQPGEADSVIIAGMGGRLMMRILEQGRKVLESVKELILQPQSEIASVRRYLQEQGYQIVAEDMVCEDGKYYMIIKAVHGRMAYDCPVFFSFGRLLLEERHPVLYEYLKNRQKVDRQILTQIDRQGSKQSQEKKQEIEQELQEIASALEYYDL